MECHPAQEIINKLLAAENVLLLTHQRPDGDALGSTFGMKEFLRSNGVAAEVLIPDGALPRRYTRMFTGYLSQVTAAELDKFDCILALDCANPERLGSGEDFNAADLRKRNFLCIDHHEGNSLSAVSSWISPQSGSTCQMVMEIIDMLDMPTTMAGATFLLTGMMTDTGCFCFSNTTGSALRAAALAVDNGANVELIANEIFFSKPLNQLNFEAALVERALRTACGGKFAYACITPELLDEFNFDLREDEGLIDILRGLEGVVIAMLVHRRADGWRVSLRSKDSRYPVRPVALQFNGGGHDLAAGCTIDVPEFKDLEEKIIPVIEKLFAE
ncbi:MAG: bifunctional oligoribonuclease/PAP phosphatase NrnA [Lentisphaerae bacterium]|nr:bifunctional oligoribonuclease/PAP phosphatase NrnA [Lentisphaerota bacterium]